MNYEIIKMASVGKALKTVGKTAIGAGAVGAGGVATAAAISDPEGFKQLGRELDRAYTQHQRQAHRRREVNRFMSSIGL